MIDPTRKKSNHPGLKYLLLPDGSEYPVQADAGGNALVAVGAPLPPGTNNIGDVDVVSLPALPAGAAHIGEVDAVLKQRNVTQSLTILNGQQVSGGYADLGGSSLVALAIPAGYIANNITIQAAKDKAAADAGTFSDVYDSDGVAVTLQVGAGARVVSLVGSALQAVSSLQYIKLKTVQAVAADRTIGIISKG